MSKMSRRATSIAFEDPLSENPFSQFSSRCIMAQSLLLSPFFHGVQPYMYKIEIILKIYLPTPVMTLFMNSPSSYRQEKTGPT